MRAPILILIALALAAPHTARAADADPPVVTELHLVSGEVVTGVLVKEDDQLVVLKRIFKNKGREMSVHMTYERSKIESMVQKKPIDEYKKRLKEMPATADANYDLAYWCVENHLEELGYEHARDALTLDPNHAKARELLLTSGLTEYEGMWYTDEQLQGRGLIRVGDRIMKIEEAEQYRKANAKLFARNELRKKLEGSRDAIERYTKQFNAESARLTKAKEQEAAAQGQADTAEQRAGNAENAVGAANQAYQTAQNADQTKPGAVEQTNLAQANLKSAKSARDQAAKDAAEAKKSLAPLKLEVIKLTASVPSLETKLAKATADERELSEKLSKAENELADEEAAHKAATPAPAPAPAPAAPSP